MRDPIKIRNCLLSIEYLVGGDDGGGRTADGSCDQRCANEDYQ